MAKNYIKETLQMIGELDKVGSEVTTAEKQIDDINTTFEEQIKEFKASRDEKLKPAEEKYRRLVDERRDIESQIGSGLAVLQDYSYFNTRIFPYIDRLMSFVDGRDYISKIVGDECIIGYYERLFQGSETYIEALRLPASFHLYFRGEQVTFDLKPRVDFQDYDYIKDYLDAFISFKIDNQLRTSVGVEFERAALIVLKQFISENLELIRQRHGLRLAEKAAEMDAIYQMVTSGDIDVGRK